MTRFGWTKHAIAVGQFAGFTSLATGDVRFKIDIPREHVFDALRIFGDAIGAQVSVARLTKPATEAPDICDHNAPLTKPRTPWHELTRAQQAGIRCGEERFADFLQNRHLLKMRKAGHDPAIFVRQRCGVSSRADLDTDSIAAAMWDALDDEYRTWSGLEAESR